MIGYIELCFAFDKHKSHTKSSCWDVLNVTKNNHTDIAHNIRRDNVFKLSFRYTRNLTDLKHVDIRISNVEVVDLLNNNEKNIFCMFMSSSRFNEKCFL